MSKIESWSGIYGSGKTWKLAERYKREYCNACIFIVMDGLETVIKDEYDIKAITFLDVIKKQNMTLNRKIFIDNADVFISIYGFYPLLKILNDYNEIYLTFVNSDFHKSLGASSVDLAASVFLESLQDMKTNKLILRENTSLPEGYADMIEKEFKYKE